MGSIFSCSLCSRISDILFSYRLPSNSQRSDETGEKASYAKDNILCLKFLRALSAEFIALVMFIPLAVGSNIPWTERNEPNNTQIALANGFTIATLIQCFVHVSGAHFNPAVSLSFAWNRDISVARAICYIVAQCLGSTVGGLFLQRVTPLEVRPPEIGCSLLGEGVSPLQGFLLEFMITFQLVFMIFATMDPSRNDVQGSAAVAIGFSVATGCLYGIPYTGASMNPARSFGPALVTGIWTYHWVYWAAPITAGLCACTLYSFIFANDASRQKLRQRLSCGDSDGVTDGRPGQRRHVPRPTYDTFDTEIHACNSI